MCQNRSYLSNREVRREVRGTFLQKAKQMVAVSFAINADGSHCLPIRYIGTSKHPYCSRDYPIAKANCTHQKNAWMDGQQFIIWLRLWYLEIKKVSEGPWLLILDNCGGHNINVYLPGVRIEFLPPRSTAVHQPLDMGVISVTKIRYRWLLLQQIIRSMLTISPENTSSTPNYVRGRHGLAQGHLPHVADSIQVFDEAWVSMEAKTIMKCWMKAEILPEEHVAALRRKIYESGDIVIDLTENPSGEAAYEHISE